MGRKLAVFDLTVVSVDEVSIENSPWFTLCHTNEDMVANRTYTICHGHDGPMLYFNLINKTPHFKKEKIHPVNDVPLLLHIIETDGTLGGTAILGSLTKGYLAVKHDKFDMKSASSDDAHFRFQYHQ